MARIRSIDFLPEIFKTDVNKEFLSATLDQLVQEPKLKQTQGYIGRRFGAGTSFNDGYVLEPTVQRSTYQLEPGVVFLDENGIVNDAITYPGIIDALSVKGANVTRNDRLFASETYSWNPLIDFDKFINYSQYYWLPNGPESVDISTGDVNLVDTFNVTRGETYYNLSGVEGVNPTITLARSGSYTFNVSQIGHSFWIQTEPGVDGTLNYSPNISNRNVLGVTNNGEDNGTVTFNVPKSTTQNFYYGLNNIGTIDLATTDRFDSINGKHVSEFNGIDGITDLENKTLVFINSQPGNSSDLGWQRTDQYDRDPYDSDEYAKTTYLDTNEERYSLFRITYVRPDGSSDSDAFIELISIDTINVNDSFKIGYGSVNSNRNFYKNAAGYFVEIPQLTAAADTLYYQDGTDENRYGIIKLVDVNETATILLADIIGKKTYTSPNGVVFTNGLKIRFTSNTTPSEYFGNEYYVEGVGSSINLVAVSDLVTPETYAESDFDQTNSSWDSSQDIPVDPDYITIKRLSNDLNPWSRSNRWFHIDVINKTAEYNNTEVSVNNNNRARRPIIEFDGGLRLYNFGTESKSFIDVIDTQETDALSNVHGSTTRIIDGYTLVEGSRVIFAADTDNNVRNKIYKVTIVDPDDASSEFGNIINLVPADDTEVLTDQTVFCLNGNSLRGKVFLFNGVSWLEAQQKTSINQPPLFDVFDIDGNSFGDQTIYSSNTFRGSPLFSYKKNSFGPSDPVLGFALTYQNIDNLGDIVFENNFYTDTFVYAVNGTSNVKNISEGFVRNYLDRTNFSSETGWTPSVDKNWQRQVFTYRYQGDPLKIDVLPRTDLIGSPLKVFINNEYILPTEYTVTRYNNYATVSLKDNVTVGSTVQIKVISEQASGTAYYEIPSNLENNIFNQNTDAFTLGIIRNHYNSLIQNISDFSGSIVGSNNLRDIGNVPAYGDVIIQHSAPISLAAHFLRKEKYDFFNSIDYVAKQYEKIKYQILDWVANNDIYGMLYSEILDAALSDINIGKTNDSAFYQSNMLPSGNNFSETVYTITPIDTDTFNTINTYDFTKANNQGLLVYLNDILLVKDYDYEVASDGPRLTLKNQVVSGDILKIREFDSTAGSFIPETPTKLGLYPKFKPMIYIDDTYATSQIVIQGHDGSVTIGFGDIRDNILLEFEQRIFNNIKVNSNIPIEFSDIAPGKFRKTDYFDSEITEILTSNFLDWVGWHKIDYKTQIYNATDEWSWNYSSAASTLDGTALKGNWRGIYKFYYDTDRPHTNPWELIGFAEQPIWWETTYGPAPYTSGNKILWKDLELGFNRNSGTYDTRYKRPGLSKIIPVDSEGNLLNPFEFLVTSYNQADLRKSWISGDIGPAENAWRRSPNWPFVVQKLFALTKTAEYFSLMVDRDLFIYDEVTKQYLYNNRYRLDSRMLPEYSLDMQKNSYLVWIFEYGCSLGIVDTSGLQNSISKTDVRLCYRMAGFSDKKYLKIFIDKSSPDSANTSLLLPDESYQILLYKNQTFSDVQYSSVMIQRTADGYSVYGNSQTQAYFRILESSTSGNFNLLSVGSVKTRIPTEFTNRVVQVPYGYTFKNINSVVDFLVSYGAFLKSAGLKFEDNENNIILNWEQMSREFVNWADENWSVESLINLNPAANQISFEKPRSVVDSLNNLDVNEVPLDQNRQPLLNKDYTVTRIDNSFKLTMLADKTLSYLRLRSTSYEHLLVFDNTSIFNDLIYRPELGLRQQRLKINGFTTFDWNGQLDAQGFILNDDNVIDWKSNISYNKGDIVKYKNAYWSAAQKIQPDENFDLDHWIKIDYNLIGKGLIPNISNKANQMTNYYNKSIANLESDADLLALGITGFRPRTYLESLNLDDISQVGVYGNLIEKKGTPTNINLFNGVEFDKETSKYNIYENWAIKRAVFGANNNNKFIDLAIDRSLINSNPCTIEIGIDDNNSDADQFVRLNDIYKQSVKNNSENIFPELNESITDTTLPTAGFVNKDDVDIILFDLNDLTNISEQLNKVRDGAYIWVAKNNRYDWNVYRCTVISPNLITAIDNLNGSLTLEFDSTIDLSINDLIIIKYFDDEINGAHRIQSIVDVKNAVITGSLEGDISSLTGNGIIFKLYPARFNQASDIATASYSGNLLDKERAWIDIDVNNKWKVYQRETTFSLKDSITPNSATGSYNFGASLAQGFEDSGLLVGAPAFNSGSGSIYCYNKNNNIYSFVTQLLPGTGNVGGYGNAIDMSKEWAVAGANESNNNQGLAVVIYKNKVENTFENWQFLTVPSGVSLTGADQFGYDVAISEDENWIYVGAPVADKVFAYQRNIYQKQTGTFLATVSSNNYNIGEFIKVDNKSQITVTIDDELQDQTKYDLNGEILTIFENLSNGSTITVNRKDNVSVNGDGSTTTFNDPTTLYNVTDIQSFQVFVDGILQQPFRDYTFNNLTQEVTFAVTPSVDSIINFKTGDYFEYITTISSPLAGERFGESVTTTSDGQQVIIAAPTATVDSLNNAGKTYIYERIVERKTVINSSAYIYPLIRNIKNNAQVFLNGIQQINTNKNVNGTYTVNTTSNTIEISSSVALSVGDIFDIGINEFVQVQTLTLADNNQGARFGTALSVCRTDCSIYVGAPKDNWVLPEAGSVSRYVNSPRVFGLITGTVLNPTVNVGDSVRINNVDVVFTNTTLSQVVFDINAALIPNVYATNINNNLVISVVNFRESPAISKLSVMPGMGSAFNDLGLAPFTNTQVIRSPFKEEYSEFGSSVHVDYSATNLTVGAKIASAKLLTEFDNDATEFDSDTTRWVDTIVDSGAVYTFDLLPSSSFSQPGQFVFGQQIFNPNMQELDGFGTQINFTDNLLVVTAPGHDTAVTNIGQIFVFENPTRSPAWQVLREEQSTVDTRLINGVYIYNANTEQVNTYLDFIDPINGKLLGPVQQNLDFIGTDDPASYNLDSTNYGIVWAKNNVGNLWWDTTNVRYVNYNQNDINYSAKNWGTIVEDSVVDVYEWVESSVPPAQYTGHGIVRDTTRYSLVTGIDQNRTVQTKYYYWVKDRSIVNKTAGKTLSAITVADYIKSPQSSGIPFAAVMRKNIVALFNVNDYINKNTDSILRIEYNQTLSDNEIFVEYDLIRENSPTDFLPDGLYRKLQDSFCGVDTLGNLVPDPSLNSNDRYGIEIRPRKTMFVDRYAALRLYIEKANKILIEHPFRETRTFNILNSREPTPTANSGSWDTTVSNLEILYYQDLSTVSVGHKYLVEVDSNNRGRWTIYEVQANNSLQLIRVQNYDTTQYWNYVNWYSVGYSDSSTPKKIVNTYSELATVDVSDNTLVKVKTNSDGKWELYVYETINGWTRVGLEDGTIQIDSAIWDYNKGLYGFDREVFDTQYFDQEPVVETRQIIKAINEELFVGDLIYNRNSLLITIFNYILSEQLSNDWLFKTSLIDVEHQVRDLKQYNIYKKDNQSFVEEYIKESKPYHVKIKEFLLKYQGTDTIDGNVYDFDCPSAYDASFRKFVSPILDNGTVVLETDISNRRIDDLVWQTRPWSTWYNNHKLNVNEISVTNGGSGYTVAPTVVVTGDANQPLEARAFINSAGTVTSIQVTNAGIGYSSTPVITITGGNGSGATAIPITKQDLVRNIKTTLKYDRYEYNTQLLDWEPNTVYNENQLLRYNNKVYRAINADGSTASDSSFDPIVHELVDSSTLSGIDRVTGFYVADVNNPGLDLALLVDGIDYPGVQVIGPRFDQNTGYDVGNFDINPWDNIEFGDEGIPTYSETILDNNIYSTFIADYSGILVDRTGVLTTPATAIANLDGNSVSNIVVVNEGQGYSEDIIPIVSVEAPQPNIRAQAVAFTNGSEITKIDFSECCLGLSVGLGYESVPTVTITPVPETPGIPATATASLNGGASVTSVIVNENGGGYITTPNVTFSDPPTVEVSRARMEVSALNSTGGVSSVTVTHPGNSYVTPPAVSVTPPPASVQATATATHQDHKVTGLTLVTAGNYYSVSPTVTLNAPTETEIQATAAATIGGGQVTNISVINPGYLYKTVPLVTITPAPATSGTTATAESTIAGGFDDDDYGFDEVRFDADVGVDAISVTRNGDGYTTPPVVTISPPDLAGGVQATATANVSGDSAPLYSGQGYITSITVTNPGSGYTSAPTITIAGPDSQINHGTGAIATASLNNTGVASISIVNAGSFYDITPTITLEAPTVPYTATASAIINNGRLSGFNILDEGWGYSTSPTVNIGPPDVTPTVAQISTTLTADEVTGYVINDSGAGYLLPPKLVVAVNAGAENDTARGTAVVVNGRVTEITITNAGDNYNVAPSVDIDAPTGETTHGTGAAAVAVLDTNTTKLTEIIVTNPGIGYDITPTVTISQPTRVTKQATAIASVVDDKISAITVTDSGTGYLSAPTVTISAPANSEPDNEINGAEFIDTYNSHAPEELVPGAIFDTLDIRVQTHPGHDNLNNGHGSQIASKSFTYATTSPSVSFNAAGALCNATGITHPVAIVVFNATNGTRLYETRNYTINWVNKTLTITSGALNGDEVRLYVYEIGGGNQIYRNSFVGSEFGNTLKIPVDADLIYQSLVFINGVEVSNYTYANLSPGFTEFTFDTVYGSLDLATVTLFGNPQVAVDSTLTNYSYSYPDTEVFIADGLTNTFLINGNIENAGRENIIVELNGRRLRPVTGVRRTGDDTTIDFYLPDSEVTGIDQSLLTDTDVVVYVGDVRQTVNSDYWLSSFSGSSGRFVTFLNPPGANAYVDIYITSSADYTVTGNTLTINNKITLVKNDVVSVTSWNDVRQQDPLTLTYVGPRIINTPSRDLFDQTRFDQGSPYFEVPFDYTTGVDSKSNTFLLYREVTSADRLWVTLDGRRLSAGQDFSIAGESVLLLAGAPISNTSVLAITSFTNSIVPDELSFRIFHDMRGNTAVYRITGSSTTYLTEQFKSGDTTMYVNDASRLGEPNITAGIFGILNINGERITYRERNLNNNTISGIRRGTAGTAIQNHPVGSVVEDQSRGNVLNYPYDKIWYLPSETTASNGIALQQQTTVPALFLKGL